MSFAVSPEVRQALAPHGALRAAINLGNPVLAQRAAENAPPHGVSVDMAQGVADLLGVGLELVVVKTAADSVRLIAGQGADIGFFAVDPARAQGIAFTPAYVCIEGAYAVLKTSALQSNAQVDAPGNRIMVGKASAYDLYLTRTIEQATLVRAATSQAVVDEMISQGVEVAACVKQQLEADLQRYPQLRILPGRFMVIEQAMGVGLARGQAAVAFLSEYVSVQKTGGAVARSLERHHVTGASVAP